MCQVPLAIASLTVRIFVTNHKRNNIDSADQLKTKCSLARLYKNTGRAIALTLVSASASASMLASAPACVEISAGPFDERVLETHILLTSKEI